MRKKISKEDYEKLNKKMKENFIDDKFSTEVYNFSKLKSKNDKFLKQIKKIYYYFYILLVNFFGFVRYNFNRILLKRRMYKFYLSENIDSGLDIPEELKSLLLSKKSSEIIEVHGISEEERMKKKPYGSIEIEKDKEISTK